MLRLEGHAASAGHLGGRGVGAALDEWASLVHDRDAVVQELRAIRLEAAAKDRAHLQELARLQRILNGQAAALARLGYRKAARRSAAREEPALDATPSQTPCVACRGPRTALDDALGHGDCAACRGRRLPP